MEYAESRSSYLRHVILCVKGGAVALFEAGHHLAAFVAWQMYQVRRGSRRPGCRAACLCPQCARSEALAGVRPLCKYPWRVHCTQLAKLQGQGGTRSCWRPALTAVTTFCAPGITR
jgi:hypothetical protein